MTTAVEWGHWAFTLQSWPEACDAYDVAWVQDKESPVDTINGFVEVYLDARSMKGAWEALVFYVNRDKTFQIRTIAENVKSGR